MENILSDKIDQFLDGKMSVDEKAAFEKEIASNETLRQQVEMQKNLRQGIERLNLKSSISSQFRKMTLKNKIYKWGVATVVVATLGAATYFGYNQLNENKPGAANYTLPQLNENGQPEWADADKNLPTQLFSINPDKDTVLETEGGIVFAIPAGAFLNAKQPVTLEVREALTPMDIIKGGLSTTSDGKQLETGGMFYLNARNGEQSLKINPAKPVYVNVPTNEIKPGMMLFSGERKPDGNINWVAPKKLEKQLLPVDIHSLDFYPKGFRAKVAELGFDANNKRVTDSIYYSYAGRENKKPVSFGEVAADYEDLFSAVGKSVDAAAAKSARYTAADQLEKKNGSPAEKAANKIEAEKMRKIADLAYSEQINGSQNNTTDLSKAQIILISYKGAAGASPNIKRTKQQAESLTDSLNLLLSEPRNRNEQFAKKYSNEPVSNIDPSWPSEKNTFLADQIQDAKDNLAITEVGECYYGYYITFLTAEAKNGTVLEINPARINAIWDDKFQNTLIATKEFEERLQVIFKTGLPEVLDLYVNNLDKKMYEIDSMAMKICGEKEFTTFYNRHDGGVAIDQPHLKALQDYFNLKRKATEMAAEKTFKDQQAKNKAADQNHANVTAQQTVNDQKRESENFERELDVNLTEAYRQLGIKRTKYNPTGGGGGGLYYGGQVLNTGWCNVDRYVYEATVNRTTLDYTDPRTGKKAMIKYEALSITVDNETDFEQVKVYLLTDSLNSFMRVSKKTNAYEENLNELFKYTLVVVAQKDGKWYWAQQSKVKPGTTTAQLNAIEESQLRVNLDYSFTKRAGEDFRNDIDAMIEQHNYTIQLQQRQKQDEIDAAIMPVIFPFYSPPAKPFSAPDMAKVKK